MRFRDLFRKVRVPSQRHALGTLVAVGAALGGAAAVSFSAAMEATSTDEFCVSCHEMRDNALAELVGTSHHTNRAGFRAACGDCHIPREFFPKMWRKIRAATEVYHHLKGTIDTPEKYEAYRMTMATKTWTGMNANDSRQCRYCHDETSWDLELQSEKAQEYHVGPLARGKTCIDCHKGLAHRLPAGIEEDAQLEGIDF
ncbi:MAG: NapC/NirT family cytochrome c [Deltaproteobacteria bacterium]|nr:NapC/NirT family cytochrome c [Deltaproteobacteria bacterium]